MYNCKYFSYPSVLACVLGAQKNSFIETVLLSTHNICFDFNRNMKNLSVILMGKPLRHPGTPKSPQSLVPQSG